ncbi:MAG: hypothetical protein U0359_34965 [Byssovorax sp.]
MPAAPATEAELLAACDAIPSADAVASRVERAIAEARRALRRATSACAAGRTTATDWRAEALREVEIGLSELSGLDGADLGRVYRAILDGLRDDLAEITAVVRRVR